MKSKEGDDLMSVINKWKLISTGYEWELYKNGDLYYTFGLGQTEYKGTDLFNIDDPHDPQQLLDLVLELIFEMEEETDIYFSYEEVKWELEEEMFSVLSEAFGGVR